MAVSTHTFQAPKGTRDFYPDDLAVRRYLESVWRGVAVNHGFDEIDGPTFEHLDLYTVKSGPGIVSELFSFRRAGGDTDYALRPEFTPTLARMYAAKANSLPKPTNWFSICSFFRAERPQRGRLREHFQWNLDVIGEDFPRADTRVLAATVDVLERFGLSPGDVQISLNHRSHLEATLADYGFDAGRMTEAITLVDAVAKLPEDEFRKRAVELGLDDARWDDFAKVLHTKQQAAGGCTLEHLQPLHDGLERLGLLDWITYAPSLARGLAYYTGTVFEVHETAGKERAIAGGGRYDNLVELFGGPATPAVGIAMGDVVIRLVLEDKGLLGAAEALVPRPDVFLISAGKPLAEERFETLLMSLRRAALHVRHSSRSTRNVGKLLGEAGKARARCAVILGDELEQGRVVLKDLDSGEQDDAVPVDGLADRIRQQLGKVGPS
jgi:histidyl-tRNA synthetase